MVTTQTTHQFLAFSWAKEPSKMQRMRSCAETCRFVTIQSLEFQEIWQNNTSETT